MSTKRVVIGTDGSAGSREAVHVGLEFAKAMGAVAVLVYVRPAPPGFLGEPYYEQSLVDELAKARAALDEAVSLAEEAEVEFESEILEGDPVRQLIELARLRDADLIAVGSRGLGTVTGALLGSVSNGIVHRADRPVLVVKERSAANRRAA